MGGHDQKDHAVTTDRRGFLGLMGAAGLAAAGWAAAGGAAGRADAAVTDAVTLANRINELVVSVHGSSWNWDQRCQQAQYYAEWAARGTEAGIFGYPTARAAYLASSIVSMDPASAPPGSFSYWDVGSAGHVVTNIGNGYCLHTSNLGATIVDFGHNLRIIRLADYPHTYLGWSYGNGANAQIAMSAWSPSGGGAGWAFNPPVASVQQRIQAALARRGRYAGPIDGVWGVESIKGIQRTCANVGYTGPIDGVPGANTCHYVQVYAARFGGYTGPIDSVLGPHSWEGFAEGLEAP